MRISFECGWMIRALRRYNVRDAPPPKPLSKSKQTRIEEPVKDDERWLRALSEEFLQARGDVKRNARVVVTKTPNRIARVKCLSIGSSFAQNRYRCFGSG